MSAFAPEAVATVPAGSISFRAFTAAEMAFANAETSAVSAPTCSVGVGDELSVFCSHLPLCSRRLQDPLRYQSNSFFLPVGLCIIPAISKYEL